MAFFHLEQQLKKLHVVRDIIDTVISLRKRPSIWYFLWFLIKFRRTVINVSAAKIYKKARRSIYSAIFSETRVLLVNKLTHICQYHSTFPLQIEERLVHKIKFKVCNLWANLLKFISQSRVKKSLSLIKCIYPLQRTAFLTTWEKRNFEHLVRPIGKWGLSQRAGIALLKKLVLLEIFIWLRKNSSK